MYWSNYILKPNAAYALRNSIQNKNITHNASLSALGRRAIFYNAGKWEKNMRITAKLIEDLDVLLFQILDILPVFS